MYHKVVIMVPSSLPHAFVQYTHSLQLRSWCHIQSCRWLNFHFTGEPLINYFDCSEDLINVRRQIGCGGVFSLLKICCSCTVCLCMAAQSFSSFLIFFSSSFSYYFRFVGEFELRCGLLCHSVEEGIAKQGQITVIGCFQSITIRTPSLSEQPFEFMTYSFKFYMNS